MKKILGLFIILLLISSIFWGNLLFPEQKKSVEEAIIEPIVVINIGHGEDEVGYSAEHSGDENDGPASFDVDKEGNIYILDTLNKKILLYEDGKWSRSMDISFMSYPRDILVTPQSLFILDEANIIYDLDKEGHIKELVQLPENVEAHEINKLFMTSRKNIAVTDGSFEYERSNQWEKKASEIRLSVSKSKKDVTLYKGSVRFLSIRFAEDTGGANIIGHDTVGNIYVEVLDFVPNSSVVSLESTIRKFDKNGKMIGVARIPLEDYSNYPLKFFDISPSNDLYIMALKENGVEVSKVTLGKSYVSKMNELKAKEGLIDETN